MCIVLKMQIVTSQAPPSSVLAQMGEVSCPPFSPLKGVMIQT